MLFVDILFYIAALFFFALIAVFYFYGKMNNPKKQTLSLKEQRRLRKNAKKKAKYGKLAK